MKGWTSIQCVGQDLAQDGSVCRHCIHVHQGVCANKHTVIPPQQGTTTFPKCCYQHFLYTLQQHAYISTNSRHRWETNKHMHTFACTHTLPHMRTHTRYWQKIHFVSSSTVSVYFVLTAFETFVWPSWDTDHNLPNHRGSQNLGQLGVVFFVFCFFTNKYPSDTTHDMTPVHIDLCYF